MDKAHPLGSSCGFPVVRSSSNSGMRDKNGRHVAMLQDLFLRSKHRQRKNKAKPINSRFAAKIMNTDKAQSTPDFETEINFDCILSPPIATAFRWNTVTTFARF